MGGFGGMDPRTGRPQMSPPWQVIRQAREVFDVSGAGDTVTAWVATALLAGGQSRRMGRPKANESTANIAGERVPERSNTGN